MESAKVKESDLKKIDGSGDAKKSNTVQGVISYCSGDQTDVTRNCFRLWSLVDIDGDDEIFTIGEICPIPKKIGLELLSLQKATPFQTGDELDNRVSTVLMGDTVDQIAPDRWQMDVGNVLFARKDKKPLTENHFEALWMFNDRILDAFDEEEDDSVAQAQAMITRDRWDQFWVKYQKKQISLIQKYGGDEDELDSWKNAVNPLTI